MYHIKIDTMEGIDLATLKMSDIHWDFGTGQALSFGAGRNKTYSYRTGVATPIGDIELSVWCALAERLIARDGELQLLANLIAWESRNNYLQLSQKALRQEALQSHIARIFDNPLWMDYIPFNYQYRPEVLQTAHIVTIVSHCCNKPGLVTQERLDAFCNGSILCPHCGCSSAYHVIDHDNPGEYE